MKLITTTALLALALTGCSSNTDKPKDGLLPGHCVNNDDCPTGTVCNRKIRWCEDIYFPRHKIKNY